MRCAPSGSSGESVRSDEGAEIPPAVFDRLFEPFTTTKPGGYRLGSANYGGVELEPRREPERKQRGSAPSKPLPAA
ncbi:MAG: hypothetical protein Kow0069_23810 [Promethearchaeota archaeon]